jgi:voltage-gated potassium channel
VVNRADRVEKWLEIPILLAALSVIPTILIQESSLGEPWQTIANVMNWTSWSIFVLELVLMLILQPNRWRWLRTHPLEILIVLLSPPVLPGSLHGIRVLRLFRLVRLLPVGPIARRTFSLEGLRYAAVMAVITILGGGAAFTAAEQGHNPAVTNTWDGVWFALVTITTVGYGDIVPHTDTGRVIASIIMIVGLGFLAILTGAIAERFIHGRSSRAQISDAEERILGELRAVEERLTGAARD